MTKVKCEICGKELEYINYLHLKTHNITVKEYREKFPNAPLERMRKISEKLKGRTKEEYEYLKRAGEKKRGRTKENNESVRRMSETLTGRTKENNESVRKQSEKMKGRTKENDEGMKAISEKLTGRTKENHEGVRRQSEKMIGRTKENHKGVKKMSEKLTGRIVTKETCQKMSEFWIGKIAEKSNAWRGGISFEPYCEKFDDDLKERVREYFGRCCYVCGIGESELNRKLDVHHVNYNKDTCCDDSKPLFVSLCRSCHGKANGNREYWEEFFTVSLNYLTNGKCFYTKEEIGGET